MKSAIDLVKILEQEAAGFAASAAAQTKMGIVVRSKESGTVVWHDTKHCEALLDTLFENGGEPIGLIRTVDNVSNGGKITIDSSLFEEYRGDLAAKTALKKICRAWGDKILRQLSQSGDPKATYFGDSSDWLQ